jgi:hypothetical protein
MERPTSMTVLGILNIVYGAMFLVCTPIGLVLFFFPQLLGNNPTLEVILASRFLLIWNITLGLLGILASAALLAAGMGLLKMRRWGRTLSIGFAIYTLVMAALNFVFCILFLFGPLLDKANQSGDAVQIAMAKFNAYTSPVGVALVVAYPIVLLIFMLRPRTLAAIQEAESEAAASAGNPPPTP